LGPPVPPLGGVGNPGSTRSIVDMLFISEHNAQFSR
jgi:hypothetical protein